MIAADIRIEGDLGLKPLRRRVTNKRALLQVAGRSGRNTYVDHLRARQATHGNKRGWKRTNFWTKAASAVSFAPVDDDTVEVSTSAIGVSLQYYGTGGLPGGVLRPLTGKYLTLPATAEAYGKRAREFADLEFGFALDGFILRPALVRRADSLVSLQRRARKNRGRDVPLPLGPGSEASSGAPIFWLVRKVKQAGDPTVLPPEGKIADNAMADVEDYLAILDERGSA